MPTHEQSVLVDRLISQTVAGFELDQVNDMIADGTDVYLAMFDLDHESHAPLVHHVSRWQPDDTEVTVTFAENILPDKQVAVDDKVLIYYLRPFNPARPEPR